MDEQEELDVDGVFRVIFCSCDVNNTDLVPVSKLIEFVKPFMIEDLDALEDLRHSLDPEGNDGLVNSERFYQAMGLWSKKFAAIPSNEESEFNRSPSRLQVIDEKELPYTHSTPRASLGDKLLKCKDLLNLSNVSGYSLSTSRLDTTNPVDSEKTVLEEEIKKLEHHLSKTSSELTITKQQLTASEEQNETLQQDLDRLNRRLHAEQQVNEHLQREKVLSDEFREELNNYKKLLEELKKKLSHAEKDSMYHKDVIDEQDREKLKLERRIEVLTAQHQDCLKEIFDVKTELETKGQQMTDVMKVYDELKLKFAEQKDFTDQLREENDILIHQKSTLEKALKSKSFNSPHSNLGNLNLDLSTHTPSPHHSTQNTFSPYYSNHNSKQQNWIQPTCQSKPLLQRVLARNSSTPISHSHSLLDSSVPDSIKSLPLLSPAKGTRDERRDQSQDSSEEDLYWKLQQGGDAKIERQDLNGTTESLQTEMHRADPIQICETYHTALFEKDEQIIELEEELEKVKTSLKESENQNNEILAQLNEQKKVNEDLVTNYCVLSTREESSQAKIESLKNKLSLLERNGIIVENDHETSQGEIEDLRNKVKMLEDEVKSKEIEYKEPKHRVETEVLLKKEICALKEKLTKAETLIEDYDEKLQATMRDLGEVSMKRVSLEEQLKALEEEKQNLTDSNHLAVEKAKLDELSKALNDKRILLEEENFVLKQDLECATSKYEHLAKRFAMLEEELCDLKNCVGTKDQETKRGEDDKKTMAVKFEEMLRLRDEELKHLKSLQQEKDEELVIFKENLEKKIVGEFEGKVKCSMEAEEKILNLTKKCKQLEEDLKSTFSKLSSKSRRLVETDNKIKYLSNLETSLKQEIENLRGSNTELELTVANLKTELDDLYAKLQKINRIDVVASEIQKHIKDKDFVIEELKQLNKKMAYNLEEAQLDLKEKIGEILKLRNEWSKGLDIKNDLWNRLKCVQKENNRLNAENRELLAKDQQLSKDSDSLNIEYNNLLIIYDLEVKKYNELKIEFDNAISKTEVHEKLNQSLSECQAKISLVESQNQELREKIAQVQKNDNMSQTEAVDIDTFEEEFSKIKIESDKLLEELEGRLNEEVAKNRNLTKDLLDLKLHLDQSNTELLVIKQKITSNEMEMVAKLQHHIDTNNKLADELSSTKETLDSKNAELNKLLTLVTQTEKELSLLNEKNIMLKKELTGKCEKLESIEQEMKTYEEKMHSEIGAKNTELLNKLTDVERLLEQRQAEMRCIENSNVQLTTELNFTKKEKEQINKELLNATSKNLVVKEEVFELKNRNEQLQDELVRTKKEKDTLNDKLQDATLELNQLKGKLSENEKTRNNLLNEIKQKLKEEVAKNRAIFDKFLLLKGDRDQLNLELNDTKASLLDATGLYNKKQTELKDWQARSSELELKIEILAEQLKASEKLLQDEINRVNIEKNVITTELSNSMTSLMKANINLKNMEVEFLEIKRELNTKSLENEKLILDLEEAKRKLSESFTPDTSANTTEKETGKLRTYSRQQIAIDKLREKLEDMENQLKSERNKTHELKNHLLLSESKIIGDEEGYKKEIEILKGQLVVKEKKIEQMETEFLEKKNEMTVSPERYEDAEGDKMKCEGKTVNKFTLAARCPASPDSPSTDIEVNGLTASRKLSFHTKCPFSIHCDSTIEIPSLDVNGSADDIIEKLEIPEGSPRKKLDKDVAEKSVTALTLRLLINSKDISDRIESETEKYRCQYEEILNLIRDISHRLRDHVCIGTAEPIMPVFVLLEDIKLQLKDVVQSAGQVGVLIYEDRMKKCWNLVTNYMAMLRQENESLNNTSRETTPTQTGIRKRNKCTQDKGDLAEKTPQRRRRVSCSRLTAILLFVLGFALTISIITHLNCRMTVSENQYCPLDGIITRINVGVPPM